MSSWLHVSILLLWTLLLAFIFAKVEVNIEGKDGWGKNLPTWRIENHWLLKVFWGGRAMTGYHAWMFPFILLIFHSPIFVTMQWSLKLEARTLAMIAVFWITEDFLWFVINPAYGIRKFNKTHGNWHKNWILGAPIEYWLFLAGSAALLWYSFR
jgi:hypothetical protein